MAFLTIGQNFRRRWGLLPPAAPVVVNKPLPKPAQPAIGMKKPEPKQIQVKTFGSGLERADIFGAMPVTAERVEAAQRAARIEMADHEREMAEFKTFDQGSGSPGGGIGPLDYGLRRGIEEWERDQKRLFAPFKTDEIQSTSPIKTLSN